MIGGNQEYDNSQKQGAQNAINAKDKLSTTTDSAKNTNSQNATIVNKTSGNSNITGTTTENFDHFGGAGSAWRSSVYSRGPVNYPNNGWENGKTEFNQFSKTGTYIKNTDLPYAVAPISTGVVKDNSPVQGTVSDFLSNYAAYGAGKKKSIKKKTVKKKKSVKKKSVKKKSLTKKKK